MKTRNLFWALFLSLPCVSPAQTYNSANLKTGMNQHTLVRNWDDRYVVTHFSDNGGSRFTCSNVGGFLGTFSSSGFTSSTRYSDSLPHVYSVSDFRVVDEFAFFCGTMKVSSIHERYIGIVGYFNLTSFLSGIFQPYILRLQDTKTLDRLTAYQVGSDYNVTAIGFDTFDTSCFLR